MYSCSVTLLQFTQRGRKPDDQLRPRVPAPHWVNPALLLLVIRNDFALFMVSLKVPLSHWGTCEGKKSVFVVGLFLWLHCLKLV